MKKIAIIVLAFSLTACIPEPELADLVKNMVVQTKYDIEGPGGQENVFNNFEKFELRLDTIGYISPFTDDTLMLDVSNTQTQLPRQTFISEMINEIKSNAEDRGFTHVEPNEDPDFAIKVVILQQFSMYQSVSYPGYYSGYYGYYGGYYGPVVTTHSSNFVTLVIEVVDIKNYDANLFRYKVIWSAYVGDLAYSIDRDTKIIESVNQAFAQSPYFSKE